MTDTAVYPQRKISLYYFRRNQDILDEGPRTLVNTDGDIGPRETSYVWTIPDVLDGTPIINKESFVYIWF